MTLLSIVPAIAAHGSAPEAIIAGPVGLVIGALLNKLVNRTDKDDTRREALASALHNEHIAKVSSDAIVHTICATKGVLKESSRKKIADCVGTYWLNLLRKDDQRISGYEEKEIPSRLTEYLTDARQGKPILLTQWKEILKEAISEGQLTLIISNSEIDQLAENLCRNYPRQLYTTIKTDLNADGAAFAGVVMRMLAEINRSVSDIRKDYGSYNQPFFGSAFATVLGNFKKFTETVLDRKPSDQLDPSAQEAREYLIEFCDEMRSALDSIKKDTVRTRWLTSTHLFLFVAFIIVAFTTAMLCIHSYRKDRQRQETLLLEISRKLPSALSSASQSGDFEKEDNATNLKNAYLLLGKNYNLPVGTLERELPKLADKLLAHGDTSLGDRANALFIKGRFAEAEATALKAKEEALSASDQSVENAIAALELAGESAEAQFHHHDALDHYRAAVNLCGRVQDRAEEICVLIDMGEVLRKLGQLGEAEKIEKELLKVFEVNKSLEASLPDARCLLALTETGRGEYAEAEKEYRFALAELEQMHGEEAAESELGAHKGLAETFNEGGGIR